MNSILSIHLKKTTAFTIAAALLITIPGAGFYHALAGEGADIGAIDSIVPIQAGGVAGNVFPVHQVNFSLNNTNVNLKTPLLNIDSREITKPPSVIDAGLPSTKDSDFQPKDKTNFSGPMVQAAVIVSGIQNNKIITEATQRTAGRYSANVRNALSRWFDQAGKQDNFNPAIQHVMRKEDGPTRMGPGLLPPRTLAQGNPQKSIDTSLGNFSSKSKPKLRSFKFISTLITTFAMVAPAFAAQSGKPDNDVLPSLTTLLMVPVVIAAGIFVYWFGLFAMAALLDHYGVEAPPNESAQVKTGNDRRILRPEERISFADKHADGTVTDRKNGQMIIPNNSRDERLLRVSDGEGGREVVQLHGFNKNGDLIDSSLIGIPPLLYASDELDKATFYRTYDTFPRRSGTYLIEVAHTHPFNEFLYEHDTHDTVRLHPLSGGDGDLGMLYDFSRLNSGIIVRGKAVLPNGYSYTVTMKNGRYVPDPFPGKWPSITAKQNTWTQEEVDEYGLATEIERDEGQIERGEGYDYVYDENGRIQRL